MATGAESEKRKARQHLNEASLIFAAQWLAGMGIPRLVIGKILNHVEQGITRVYDRHSYDAEKKQALDAWGARLAKIVSGLELVKAENGEAF